MSSGWSIYTKLEIPEMVELFEPLPIHYPSVFGFYSDNKILKPDQNQLWNCAHFISDPFHVYRENTAREEYLNGYYEEDYGFRPVSRINIETGNNEEVRHGKAFLHFIKNFLSGMDSFLIHTSTRGSPEELPNDFEPPQAYRLKDMRDN